MKSYCACGTPASFVHKVEDGRIYHSCDEHRCTECSPMIKFLWEEDCTEWNSQVNKAATHVGKYFESLDFDEVEIRGIISRFNDFITLEEINATH